MTEPRTEPLVVRVLAPLVLVPFLLGAAASPSERADVAFRLTDPDITESSGLVVRGDLAFTVNDSGDSGRVFTVDTSTGETVGTTSYAAEATDVEALAPADDNEVWVGDIGDNLERRDSVTVTRVVVGRGEIAGATPQYELVYSDGPHDAETLLADPADGRLYVVTKSVLGGRLYAAPAQLSADGPNELTPVTGDGAVLPIATDGAFLPDGQHVVVRNYTAAAVYDWPSMQRVATFPLPSQEQGEGIAVEPDATLLLSSEGQDAPVLRVDLPADVTAALAPTPAATSSPSSSPPSNPSASDAASPSASPSEAAASPTYRTESREDRELPEATQTSPNAWPWFLSGIIGVGVIVVLGFSLRRR